MKLYNSYIKENKKGEIEDLIFVKSGFSFWAFFFSFLWFLYHKMFKATVTAFFLYIFLGWLITLYNPNDLDASIISISVSIIIAINANFWYAQYLEKKGYKFAGCVFGNSFRAAKLRFVEGFIEKEGDRNVKHYKFLNEQEKVKS